MLTAKELNGTLPYTFDGEIDYIQSVVSQLDPEAEVVMIGAGPGVMALAVMEVAPYPLWFHIIDIDTHQWTEKHLEAGGFKDEIGYHISMLRGDSGNWGERWNTEIDFLIADGDHSYKGVKHDIEVWWPKVKEGGIVFFHDYEWEKVPTGVKQAIDELKDETWLEIARPGISIVFRKIKK